MGLYSVFNTFCDAIQTFQVITTPKLVLADAEARDGRPMDFHRTSEGRAFRIAPSLVRRPKDVQPLTSPTRKPISLTASCSATKMLSPPSPSPCQGLVTPSAKHQQSLMTRMGMKKRTMMMTLSLISKVMSISICSVRVDVVAAAGRARTGPR